MVEGIFDAFALMLKQLPVVALMGKEISSEQIRLTMRWSKVIVLLDGGFTRDGLKVAKSLEGVIDEVYVATMPEGTDPSDSPELAVEAVEKAMSLNCF
jgi:DNA primase